MIQYKPYNAVHYCILQFTTLQYSTLQCNTEFLCCLFQYHEFRVTVTKGRKGSPEVCNCTSLHNDKVCVNNVFFHLRMLLSFNIEGVISSISKK